MSTPPQNNSGPAQQHNMSPDPNRATNEHLGTPMNLAGQFDAEAPPNGGKRTRRRKNGNKKKKTKTKRRKTLKKRRKTRRKNIK